MIDDDGELIGGRYALGELLGVGGTGSVFAATDRESGADVAIKLLHPHLCDDEASRNAFLREASHVMGLSHPNIVRVHAAGLHDAGGVVMPWIALDLLHGPTLREWVEATGRLAPRDAAAVAEGMLAALGHAHAAGIVHRDISPQNIVLHGVGDRTADTALTSDMVRVVDFGLADVTGRATVGADVLLAGEGDAVGVVGNAAYMSPEQAEGRPVRAVSDLYQAGAVLYYALTARPPFPRASTAQVLQAHVSAPPPVPSSLAPAARRFDRIVTRAMAKTPARRPRDAAEFALAVTDAASRVVAPSVAEPSIDAEIERSLVADDDRGDAPTRVFPGTPAALDYLAPVEGAAPAASRSNAGFAAGAIAVIVLAVAGWAVMASAAAPADPTADAPSSSPSVTIATPLATPSAPPTTPPNDAAPPPAPEPAQIPVPALHGSLADAENVLRTAGLVLGAITRVESSDMADRVLAQRPEAQVGVALGSAVDVTVASGSNVVPQVAGMTYAAAVAQLESAGFVVTGQRPAAGGTATGTQPGAGAVLRIGVSVALLVAPDPAPSPTQTRPAPIPTEESP